MHRQAINGLLPHHLRVVFGAPGECGRRVPKRERFGRVAEVQLAGVEVFSDVTRVARIETDPGRVRCVGRWGELSRD